MEGSARSHIMSKHSKAATVIVSIDFTFPTTTMSDFPFNLQLEAVYIFASARFPRSLFKPTFRFVSQIAKARAFMIILCAIIFASNADGEVTLLFFSPPSLLLLVLRQSTSSSFKYKNI